MFEPAPKPQYNLILGRYNELGLKSKKVRARMEKRLLGYVQSICAREGINLTSASREWGRLIFLISPAQIPDAIQVFRHLIGIHSFSPGFRIDTEYPTVERAVLDTAAGYLEDGDTYAVRVRRTKKYHMTSLEMERDLGGQVMDAFEAEGKTLNVKLKNPSKTIFIEVRDKHSYIYTDKIPTTWGGNPIESDKGLLSLWTGKNDEAVATQLLLRRGAVPLPIVFRSPVMNQNEVDLNLKRIARFVSIPLPVIFVDIQPLWDLIETICTPAEFEVCQFYAEFIILERLIHRLNQDRTIIYQKQPVRFRGVVSALSTAQPNLLNIGQQSQMVHFSSLTGLSTSMIQSLRTRLELTGEEIASAEEFSLGIVVTNEDKTPIEPTIEPNSEPVDLDKIKNYFENKSIQESITKIVSLSQVETIIGSILSEK